MTDRNPYCKGVLDKIVIDVAELSQKTGLDGRASYSKLKELMLQENPFSRRYACYCCLKTIDDKILRFIFPDQVNVYFSEKHLDELLSEKL